MAVPVGLERAARGQADQDQVVPGAFVVADPAVLRRVVAAGGDPAVLRRMVAAGGDPAVLRRMVAAGGDPAVLRPVVAGGDRAAVIPRRATAVMIITTIITARA